MKRKYSVKGTTSMFPKRKDVILQIKSKRAVMVTIETTEGVDGNTNHFVMFEGAPIGVVYTKGFTELDMRELKECSITSQELTTIFQADSIQEGIISITEVASDKSIMSDKNSKEHSKFVNMGVKVGMSKSEAEERIALLVYRYGLNKEQLEMVANYWKKPDVDMKGNIPAISKVIYQDSFNRPLYRVLGHIVKDGTSAIRLVGTMSTGKGVLIESLASLLYVPLLEVDMQRNTEAEDFEGRETLSYKEVETGNYEELLKVLMEGQDKNDDTAIGKVIAKSTALSMSSKKIIQTLEFIKEPLTIAMEKGCWVNFDEINFAQAYILSRLHRVLDGRQSIHISGYKTIYAADKFAFFSTMNPPRTGFAGTTTMNEALESRMMTIYLEPTDRIDKILSSKYPNADRKDIAVLEAIYHQVKKSYDANNISESYLSLRRYEAALTQQGFGTFKMSIEDHLLNISCNEDADRETMKDLIELSIE